MLYESTNYTADISYLTNVFITEYDISKCNINILYTRGIIDRNTYNYLYKSERMLRQTYIGKLQKEDPNIYKELKAGIIEAKKLLFENNNIRDCDVLSIKNDAVFLINKKPNITKFGLVEFLPKNIYTSFYKLSNLEIYYYYNNMSKEEYIEVKGISNKALDLHKDYFLQIIKDILYFIQTSGPEIALRTLKDYYNDYITLKLPIGCYRMFDSYSNYHLKFNTIINTGFSANFLSEKDKNLIDINYNLNILLQLQRYIISMYFNKYK